MAVIKDGAVIVEVFDRMATMGGASKILMSQRQYDEMAHFLKREHPLAEPDRRDFLMAFNVPIVICPDCDLHVVPPTINACYGADTFVVPMTDGAPVVQKGIVVSDDGRIEF